MVEVEEIELDLGLSIGGCFRENSKPDSRPDGFRSDSDPHVLQRGGSVVVDDPQPQDHHKREIQALRRMEAKKKREQKRERVVKEIIEPECQRVWKKEKTENCVNGVSAWTTSTPFQVQQSAHHFATVQYLPLNNGYALPCWVASKKNVGPLDGVNVADGSSRCSSSAVSDYQSSSREDGGSSDSLSHSTHSLAELTQLNSSNINTRNQPEQHASSHPMKSNSQERNHIVKDTSTLPVPNITQSKPLDPKEAAALFTNIQTHQNPISPNDNSSNRVEMGNSEKPMSQICSSLPQMPYVSTKGNGPNGKTVNGFLYRYSSKSEVSIVCVCHGSTFSPAEFVQHAGGTDISHPLKHITVIPSAFA